MKNYWVITLVLAIAFLGSTSKGYCQTVPHLPESDKRFIVRLCNPENKQGTGFFVSDSICGYLLITNRHVVSSSKTGEIFDSVQLFANNIGANGKVISSDSHQTLYLRHGGVPLYVEHPNKSVDLIVVGIGSIGVEFSNPAGLDKLYGYKRSFICARDRFNPSAVNDGMGVQIIGFSEPLPQKDQFHISRFGHISYYPCEDISVKIDGGVQSLDWLVIDASSRGGDSGGPLFFSDPKSGAICLLGFVQAINQQDELCYAIPSYYILEVIDLLRHR